MKPSQVAVGVAAVGVAGLLAFAVSKKAGAEACIFVQPGIRYYGTYTGPTQKVKTALGECWSTIYTLDVFDQETGDYWPVVNPEQDLLFHGSKIAVQVQGQCRLCAFALNI
jgi:hypothetical protein